VKPMAPIEAMFSSSGKGLGAAKAQAQGSSALMSKTRWGALVLALLLSLAVLPTVAQAEQCPNEQLRREDNSTRLPECQAYELVSAPFKNGAAVAISQPVMSLPSGEKALYASTGVFAGAQGSPLANGYIATRGPTGWSTIPTEAPQANEGVILANPTQGIARDLTKTLQASAMVLAPGAVQGNGNIYVRDNVAGGWTLVGTSGGPFAFREFGSTIYSTFIGATPNFSHVVFDYGFTLMPGAVEGATNIYDWSGGELHLVNYLPDGTVATGASGPIASGISGEEPHPVSNDGTKVFFSIAGGLYVRENNTTTIPISASQRAGDLGTVQQATFAGASADGSVVYFMSGSELVEGPETPLGYGRLYRYDLRTGHLSSLAVSSAPSDAETGASVQRVIQVSEDGSYVYFTAQGDLAPGASTAGYGFTNLYVWHEGAGIKFIARANVGGQLSPNGLHLAFTTETPLTAYHCSGCAMLYDYDYETGEIRCVSCNPSGAPPAGELRVGGIPYGTGLDDYHPKYVLDNGKIFFTTKDALLPQDTNGTYDVYQWQNGSLSLISTGTGSGETEFADASADGANVFFKTGQRLVGQDVDANVDLYDARVGGGFPAPPAENPCTGTGCQGVPPAGPIFATPPSVTFTGVGNFEGPVKAATPAKPKSLTRAQKLAAALKACRKHKPGKARRTCEKRARKQYAKTASAKRAKTGSAKSNATKSNGRDN
jgi:hypothetical protein